ncbi:MAG: HIT domain-containing protein, partial [Fusobacteriaceae bacterium]|nr:HIT domain-containing protein [Fusobacteriaceae bacterium]
MKDCLFCKIYEKREIFYENKFFCSRWDKFPITLGHAEVIPKKHIVSLMDLSQEEWSYLKPA